MPYKIAMLSKAGILLKGQVLPSAVRKILVLCCVRRWTLVSIGRILL